MFSFIQLWHVIALNHGHPLILIRKPSYKKQIKMLSKTFTSCVIMSTSAPIRALKTYAPGAHVCAMFQAVIVIRTEEDREKDFCIKSVCVILFL